MQKIINVLAVLSFLGTASIVGAGTYVYLNKDALIESAKKEATKAATDAVMKALPKIVEEMMPDVPAMPTTTGPTIPF